MHALPSVVDVTVNVGFDVGFTAACMYCRVSVDKRDKPAILTVILYHGGEQRERETERERDVCMECGQCLRSVRHNISIDW